MHPDLNGFTPDKIFQYFSDHNIDKAWFLTWDEIDPPISEIYSPITIDRVIELYRMDKDRIVPFYAPDPRRENACDLLKYYQKQGVKGCGELKVTLQWNDSEILNFLSCLQELKFPLIFHMENSRSYYSYNKNSWLDKNFEKLMNGAFNGISRYYIDQFINYTGLFKKQINKKLVQFPGYLYDFALFEETIQKFPNVNFICHGPTFWKNISAHPSTYKYFDSGKIEKPGLSCELLKRYDNIYADISGKSGYFALTRDKKFTREFLDKNYHKLLFGTDNFIFNQQDFLNEFSLSDEKLSSIYYKNAENLIL
jgi:predicted TIM-barrel fold metal-dependent hydrolase